MIIVLYLQLESDIKLLSTFIIASVAFLCADTTFAETIHYPSSEYATIQEAVNAAVDGDGDGEVKVADLLLLIGAWGACP